MDGSQRIQQTTKTMIETKGLSKYFGHLVAIKEISFANPRDRSRLSDGRAAAAALATRFAKW